MLQFNNALESQVNDFDDFVDVAISFVLCVEHAIAQCQENMAFHLSVNCSASNAVEEHIHGFVEFVAEATGHGPGYVRDAINRGLEQILVLAPTQSVHYISPRPVQILLEATTVYTCDPREQIQAIRIYFMVSVKMIESEESELVKKDIVVGSTPAKHQHSRMHCSQDACSKRVSDFAWTQ